MTGIIGIAIIAIVVLIFISIVASSYKKVASNEALVIWGAGIKDGYKIKKGGASFVIPGLQQSEVLSFTPMVTQIDINDIRSKERVGVNIGTTFTLAVGSSDELLKIAAQKLLELDADEIIGQSQEIIEGQLRAIVVNMDLDELDSSRKSFEDQIESNTAHELAKLGIELINKPNIRYINDDGGYFEARGTKASVEAKSAMNIDIAEAEKKGEIGTKEAKREQEIKTAELDKDQEIKTANFQTEKEIGMAEAKRTQEVRTAELEAEKVQGQNISRAIAAESEKELKVKEAKYNKETQTAEIQAQIQVQKLNAERELEQLRATEVAKVKAEKEQIEIEAEAAKIKMIKEAEAEATKIKLAAEAEAEGIKAVMDAKSAGYLNMVTAIGKENLSTIMMLEQLVEVTKVKTEALQNLKVDKITVWDNPSSDASKEGRGGINGFVDNFANAMPGMHEIAKDAGITMPAYLGTLDSDKAEVQVVTEDIEPDQEEEKEEDAA